MASHGPPKPLNSVLVLTAPYNTLPVVSYFAPFLVNTAMRELTIWTMWSGPAARLLSEGLRPPDGPSGPVKPAPRPSKLSTSSAAGRLPCEVCSTAAAARGTGGGGGGGVSGAPRPPCGDVPQSPSGSSQPSSSRSGVRESARAARGGDVSNFSARWTITWGRDLTKRTPPTIKIRNETPHRIRLATDAVYSGPASVCNRLIP